METLIRINDIQSASELLKRDDLSVEEIRALFSYTWSNVMFLSTEQIRGALSRLQEFSNVHPAVKAWTEFSSLYSGHANKIETVDHFSPVIEQFRELNDRSGEGACYCIRGMMNKTLGRLDQAHHDYNLCLDMMEQGTMFEHFRKVCTYQLAELFVLLKDLNSARKYFEICLANTAPGDGLHGRALNGCGIIYLRNKEYETAISLFNRSLSECGVSNNRRLYSKNLVDVAQCYIYLGQPDKAIPSLSESLDIRLADKSYDAAITNYILLAEIFLGENKTDEALEAALMADRYAKELNITIKELQTEKILAEIYEKKNDFASALKHCKRFHELDSTINGQEMARKLEQVKARHEIIHVEQEKEIFRLKNVELKSALEEINESIRYARHIQQAILPSESFISAYLPESFVLYLPKDIVAGDFYWAANVGDKILIAAADCTGHGVPGALVSVVCSNALNRATKEFNLALPGEILDKVRELVIDTFHKSGQDVKDGMDISLCLIDPVSREIAWAGANNALWYTNDFSIAELAPDKQPVGKHPGQKPFSTHHLKLKKGEMVYCFTDGYADQFGGERGKKLKYTKFKELLLENHKSSMTAQKEILSDFFNEWRGSLEQIDDVCVIGIRL